MKLIIQIPCFNEEKTLPAVIKDLPKNIGGISSIEILVINDGSTDKTEEAAKSLKVDHVLNLSKRRGLAYAFKAGLDKAIELGADIIVNTDGDNQYKGSYIEALITPIMKKKADMVVGCRDMSEIKHFSPLKRLLQHVGSYVVRKFSDTEIPDATSGFRAYSRDAALRINIFSDYTYTLESIIQAGRSNLHIEHVKVLTNPKLRESRLITSIPGYVARSVATILRMYVMYEPLKSFFIASLVPILAGIVLIARFILAHFTRITGGHVQSLIIAAILIILGSGIMLMGLLGDIISANRKIEEEILYRMKKTGRV
jgi:glycosyltransferase involved in cell wall biosynthesis